MEFVFLADREDVIPMLAQWYFDEWGHLHEDETLARSEERLREYLNKNQIPFILLAMDGDKVMGTAQLKYREMGDIFPDKEHWLGGVFVSPHHRRTGVGAELVEEVARRAPEYGVQTLHLQTERLDGGLYKRLGWLPVQKVAYRGLNVLVMERDVGT